ncbi:hypothetical protein V2J09_013168 [Rumex salicifolius]
MFFCEHCQIPNHSIGRCFKIHGYPPRNDREKSQNQQKGVTYTASTDHGGDSVDSAGSSFVNDNKGSVLTKEQYDKLIALLGQTEVLDAGNVNSQSWVIDSGATHHITLDLSLFDNYTVLPKAEFISMPDGSRKEIKHVGTVHLRGKFTIRNVLHVPKFSFNLISVTHLTKDLNFNLLFTPSQCLFVQSHSMSKSRVLGEQHKGLNLTTSHSTHGKHKTFSQATNSFSNCY